MTMKHAAKLLTWTSDFLPGTQSMTDGFLKNIIYHLVGTSTYIAAQYTHETSSLSYASRSITFCPFSRPSILGSYVLLLFVINVYISKSPFSSIY